MNQEIKLEKRVLFSLFAEAIREWYKKGGEQVLRVEVVFLDSGNLSCEIFKDTEENEE